MTEPALIPLSDFHEYREQTIGTFGVTLAKLNSVAIPILPTVAIPPALLSPEALSRHSVREAIIKIYQHELNGNFVSLFDQTGKILAHNIQGEANLIESLSSLAQSKPILVQSQPISTASGSIETAAHTADQKKAIKITAWLGVLVKQATTSSEVSAQHDVYYMDPSGLRLLQKHIELKDISFQPSLDTVKKLKLKTAQTNPVLSATQLAKLTELALRVKQQSMQQQQIAWVLVRDQFFISHLEPQRELEPRLTKSFLISGRTVMGGVVEGVVQFEPQQISLLTTPDTVLVTKRLRTQDIKNIKSFTAIISEESIRDLYVLKVIKQYGIPTIDQVRYATQKLKPGSRIIVQASEGTISPSQIGNFNQYHTQNNQTTTTVTRVLLSVGNPNTVQKMLPTADGVFFRSDFIFVNHGLHPLFLISRHRASLQKEIVQALFQLGQGLRADNLLYQPLSLNSLELRALDEGERYEPAEENPLLGVGGALRVLSQPQIFEFELETACKASQELKQSLDFVLPFHRSQSELFLLTKKSLQLIAEHGGQIKLWAKISTPQMLQEVVNRPNPLLTGYIVAIEKIYGLLVGADQSDPELKELYPFDIETMSSLLRPVQKIPQKIGVEMLALHTQMVHTVVDLGLSLIITKPAASQRIKQLVQEYEQDSLMKKQTV